MNIIIKGHSSLGICSPYPVSQDQQMKGMTLILKAKNWEFRMLVAQGEMWFEYKQNPWAYMFQHSIPSWWCCLVMRWPLEIGALRHWMGQVWFWRLRGLHFEFFFFLLFSLGSLPIPSQLPALIRQCLAPATMLHLWWHEWQVSLLCEPPRGSLCVDFSGLLPKLLHYMSVV